MKKMMLASTSTLYGGEYLAYILPSLKLFFKGIDEVLFIPYARPGGISYDEYTHVAAEGFAKIDIKIKGLHEFENSKDAINNAKGIFTGGGNTFVLVQELYKHRLFSNLKNVIEKGRPYFGTSAGSNIAGINMQTTNDMPIVQPTSFSTLGLVPFNLNPHYLDPDVRSKHKGETRETRIREFHTYNDIPVLGLREGSWLEIVGEKIILKGNLKARFFRKDKNPEELDPKTNLYSLVES